MKYFFKLLTISLLISIISLPVLMAMEDEAIKDGTNKTELECALRTASDQAHGGNLAPIRQLLESGVSANDVFNSLVDRVNEERGFVNVQELIELFDEYGLDVNKRKDWVIPPLLCAVSIKNSLPLVRWLIQKGAHVNAIGMMGRTALMFALDIETAQLLIANDADINARDYEGDTVMRYAFDRSLELFEFFIQKGCKWTSNILRAAIRMRDPQRLELVLKHGLHDDCIQHEFRLGLKTLCSAIGADHDRFKASVPKYNLLPQDLQCAQLLLDYGTAVDAETKLCDRGITILMIISGYGPLLSGETRLENAVDFTPFATLLLCYGANRDLKNGGGMTARDIAKRYGDTAMVELLDTYHPWGEGNHRKSLKFRAAQAVLAECKHMSKEEVKEVFQAIPANIRDVVCLIAPREVKEKIGFKPNFEMVKKDNDNNNK